MMKTLESDRIDGPPPSMYYVSDFISKEEEQSILQKIPSRRWTSLSNRRLQAIPTQLTANNTLLSSSLPEWLVNPVIDRLNGLKVFEEAPHGINHCLVNEYLPGQGIMSHEDGAAYHPIVATVSLGSTIVLDVSTKTTDQESAHKWRIVQEPRSLLVTTGSAYHGTLHGIAEVEEDHELNSNTVANWSQLADWKAIEAEGGMNRRGTRISLTLRDVLKVSSAGRKIFGKGRS